MRNDGTRTDEEMWVAFHELHVEPLLQDMGAIWVAPVPMRHYDDDLEIDELADSDGVEDDEGVESCRHPFGLFNPPGKVWEAHQRLVLGIGNSGDRGLVDAFAAKNAYHGKGLGQYKSISRRTKVQRQCYSLKLAKERRIKKELESKQSRM